MTRYLTKSRWDGVRTPKSLHTWAPVQRALGVWQNIKGGLTAYRRHYPEKAKTPAKKWAASQPPLVLINDAMKALQRGFE
jgi:hypothetical protein